MTEYDLTSKKMDIDYMVGVALSEKDLLHDLMEGLLSKDDTTRRNCFEILLQISKQEPAALYEKWDFFVELLSRSNNYSKYIAVYILAQLTAVDTSNKFISIFDDYFALLGGTRAMISSHVALNSAVIAHNKPDMLPGIVDILLDVENIHQGKQVELIKSYTIQALQEIYPEYSDKKRIEEFVKSNLDSKSPKTREAAKSFLETVN